MLIVLAYLAANVLSNLSVSYFGAISTPINAFLLIAFDLVSRDALHERWHHNNLKLKMLLLIGTGATLSYFLNRGAGQIAIASFVAFLLTGLTDTLVYQMLRNQPKLIKVNGSNIVSAAVDSIAFPTIAFGSFIPWVIIAQFSAKIFGGYIWSLILFRGNKRKKGEATA
ncbi:VUT family protein [Desulfitobacterium sp.]|uniref:VUT family protein n=1 Tax=Desulfitobacterium sp. TaxID=49981 RepID=UPI002B1F5880|nr:VUT family protein [Desulfitobacterium sp.]MEA4903167.1 VUT family protein [Desulfitobacterium sp.]